MICVEHCIHLTSKLLLYWTILFSNQKIFILGLLWPYIYDGIQLQVLACCRWTVLVLSWFEITQLLVLQQPVVLSWVILLSWQQGCSVLIGLCFSVLDWMNSCWGLSCAGACIGLMSTIILLCAGNVEKNRGSYGKFSRWINRSFPVIAILSSSSAKIPVCNVVAIGSFVNFFYLEDVLVYASSACSCIHLIVFKCD